MLTKTIIAQEFIQLRVSFKMRMEIKWHHSLFQVDWERGWDIHLNETRTVVRKRQWQPTRVLAWRIPGTAEPGGLPSMGSHRVGHDKRLSSSRRTVVTNKFLKVSIQLLTAMTQIHCLKLLFRYIDWRVRSWRFFSSRATVPKFSPFSFSFHWHQFTHVLRWKWPLCRHHHQQNSIFSTKLNRVLFLD